MKCIYIFINTKKLVNWKCSEETLFNVAINVAFLKKKMSEIDVVKIDNLFKNSSI